MRSRRVAGVEPDEEGRFTVRNLPAGDYEQLVSRAQRISIGADNTSHDLT